MDKLEVIQNNALRIASRCHQKVVLSDLRAETEVLPLREHLELCSQQFYESALQPTHPSLLPIPALIHFGQHSRPRTIKHSEACESLNGLRIDS